MPRLSCEVNPETYKKFENKVKSMGLNNASYLRSLVTASLKRSEDTLTLKDVQKSILALLPAIAEAFGIAYKQPKDVKHKLSKTLLKVWEESFQDSQTDRRSK